MVRKEGKMERRSRGKRRNGSTYSHAPVSGVSLSAVYCGPKKNWKIK
jgi:hypothetical protein